MFYNYEIHNNGKEDILYLYLTMAYEFANDFSFEDVSDLSRRAKNFILSNNVPFKGSKVYLIVDGVIVKSLDISNVISRVPNSSYAADNFMVTLNLDDNSFCEISLREYLTSILFSYYDLNIHEEVLKCLCILYNGYAYKMMEKVGSIQASLEFVIYKPLSYYKSLYSDFDFILRKINTIISEMDSFFLRYNNDYILPFIHYSNSGITKSKRLYPYLSSVRSLWDLSSPYFINIQDFSYQELIVRFNIPLKNTSRLFFSSKKNIQRIVLGDKLFTLEEFKNLLDLKSDNIFVIAYNDSLKIITMGLGNSYGISIFGANELAKSGAKYYNILKYYFPKTNLFKHIKELS